MDYEVVCDSADRETWLRARRATLGASDVASVLGLSPWRPSIETWAEKTSKYDESPDRVTEPMQIGNELEPVLLAMLAKRTRCPVTPAGKLLRSKRWPWLSATLDGTIVAQRDSPLRHIASHGTEGVVETKSVGGSFADDWLSMSDDSAGHVPEHYRPQITAQLAVTGAPFAVFGGLLGGRGFRFRWTAIERNEAEIRDLVEKTEEWWHRHVENDVAPEPDGSDRAEEIIGRIWPGAAGAVNLDDEADELVSKLLAVRSELRNLRAEDSRLAQLIERRLAEAAPERLAEGAKVIGKLPDGREVVWATQSRKGFTVQPSTFRVLRLPKTTF